MHHFLRLLLLATPLIVLAAVFWPTHPQIAGFLASLYGVVWIIALLWFGLAGRRRSKVLASQGEDQELAE